MWWCGGNLASSGPGFQDGLYILGRRSSFADLYQKPDEAPHHFVEKSVSCREKHKVVPMMANHQPGDPPGGIVYWAIGVGGKGRSESVV